jgi:DNA mismatch repair protein MutL
MSRIQRLDPQTVEQIRAGEVIERPGSVVKELVENAIDAGAQTVRVQIVEGGIREITVHDDGQGMPSEDALLAVQRHTTSKIRRSSDLFGLSTLGFRGEALASIAAISRLEIVSRVADALEGICVRVAGSEPAESSPTAANRGTTVSVRHLFFNTPPRRAFLKSPAAEGNYIEDVLIGLALSRPELRFVFTRDGKLVFDALPHTGPQALGLRAGAVLGDVWSASLVLADDGMEDADVRLHGILGPPEHTKNTRTGQYFYVNGRQVKSQPLSSALSRAYGELLPAKRFPVGVLFVSVSPRELDVNVHPTKREVKFQDEQAVLGALIGQVRRTLDRANLFKRLELPAAVPGSVPTVGSGAPSDDISIPDPDDSPLRRTPPPTSISSTPAAPSRPQRQAALRMVPQPQVREAAPVSRPAPAAPPGHGAVAEPAQPDLLPRPQDPVFRVVGQSHELFILVEVEAELWLVDQHAAHERVMYEQVLATLHDGTGESQALLLPVTFELEASARTALDELQDYLTRVGFDIRPFGGKTYQVQAAPPYFRPADTPELIVELAQSRAAGRSEDSVAAKQEDLAARVACKVKSVKAGQSLTPESMKALLKSLLACQSPFTCPHGRPTMVRMSVKQLEGQFDRR